MKRRIVWKRVLVLVAGVLGLCVLGIAALFYLGQPLLGVVRAAMWTADSAAAHTAAHEMLEYQLPAGYEETKVRSVGDAAVAVMITNSERPANFILLEGVVQGIRETEQWRTRYEERWYNEVDQRRYDVQTVEIRQIQVAGALTPVRFLEGTDRNGQPVNLVVCIVPGKAGDVLVGMLGSADDWDAEEVNVFLRSIQ